MISSSLLVHFVLLHVLILLNKQRIFIQEKLPGQLIYIQYTHIYIHVSHLYLLNNFTKVVHICMIIWPTVLNRYVKAGAVSASAQVLMRYRIIL
jgi:hypothetical protein